jgi:hypothetical protein
MLRKSACAAIALIVLAGSLLAADAKADKDAKKEGKEVKATVVKVNADKNTLTVKMEDGKTKEIKIGKSTKFVGPRGGVSDDGIKDDRLTAGAEVTLMMSADGKSVSEVRLPVRKGGADKKPSDAKGADKK